MKSASTPFAAFFLILLSVSFESSIRCHAAETKPPVSISINADSPWPDSPGYHLLKGNAKVEGKECPIAFGLFLPAVYFTNDKPFPLVVTLHNAGVGGADGNNLTGEGLGMLMVNDIGSDRRHSGAMPPNPVNIRKKANFIGLAPQCAKDMGFERAPMNQVVIELINVVGKRYRVDGDRVGLTGFSYGGSCTWAIGMEFPERFAAIMPLDARAAPTPEKSAERLKNVGVWIGAGENDGDFTNASRQMYDLLKKGNHPNVQLTLIKGGEHHCYQAMYGDPKFWDWFYAQSRKKTK